MSDRELTKKEIEDNTCKVCGGLRGFDEGCGACSEDTFFEAND